MCKWIMILTEMVTCKLTKRIPQLVKEARRMSTGKLINWKIESESESCEIQISLSMMFCTLSFYGCTVHDKLQCFCWQVFRTFVWELQYSCLQFQILSFARLYILVCRSERSRGDSSSSMGRDTRERMGLWGWGPLDWWDLGYLTKIWGEVQEIKGGGGYGSEDCVP